MELKAQVYVLLAYHILIALVIASVLPLINISFASDPSPLINPFIGSVEVCGDGKDNDGNGFVDDNCGTASLKVINNMSGAIANISSICHEDCDKEGDE
jgi:hypothetical protein